MGSQLDGSSKPANCKYVLLNLEELAIRIGSSLQSHVVLLLDVRIAM